MINPIGLLIRIIVMAAIVIIGSAIVRNITDTLNRAVGGPVWHAAADWHPASHGKDGEPTHISRFYDVAIPTDR